MVTGPLRSAAVIGTGTMGPGIAAACAVAGLAVTVYGRDGAKAQSAAERASAYAAAVAKIETPIKAAQLAQQDLGANIVIETIVEDIDAKKQLYRQISELLDPDVVLATNTSSFLIGSLAPAVTQPQRFAGMHFLNPAHETAVIEVVSGPSTSDETVETLASLSRLMGKTPLIVRHEVEGFIWNRIQHAVLRECLHLLDEGVADIASIDAAVSDGLAPRWVGSGPLATADLGNIRTWRLVAEQLFGALSASATVPKSLTDRADSDGAFYRWDDQSREAIAKLRGEILRSQSKAIQQRRAAMPPTDNEGGGAD